MRGYGQTTQGIKEGDKTRFEIFRADGLSIDRSSLSSRSVYQRIVTAIFRDSIHYCFVQQWARKRQVCKGEIYFLFKILILTRLFLSMKNVFILGPNYALVVG